MNQNIQQQPRHRHRHRHNRHEIIRKFRRHKKVAEMMGIDTRDPEMMGGLLKNIIAKIAAKRRARIESGNAKDFSLNTPFGTVNAGDSGFGYTANQTGNNGASGVPSTIGGIDKKMLLIGGAVAVAGAVFLMRRK